MDIFIDANVFLSFYEASPDALLELAKIAAIIKAGQAKLWLPDQVKREFWKNREGSIAAALREFEKSPGFGSVPRLINEDPGFEKLRELASEMEKHKTEIVARVRRVVKNEKTAADKEVRMLFSLATEIDTSGNIFTEAHERALRHTPPGKQDQVGDRLSWVALLKSVPELVELHVISIDGDFASEANQNEINPYLNAEWSNKKQGKVKLWRRASQFLAAHFPDAASAIEIERTLMVESLEKSPNFATTHSIIAEFSDLSHLNQLLIDRLAHAILNNPQVRRVRGDGDVKEFITNFLAKYQSQIQSPTKEELKKLLDQ
jgi:hypothetical protein